MILRGIGRAACQFGNLYGPFGLGLISLTVDLEPFRRLLPLAAKN